MLVLGGVITLVDNIRWCRLVGLVPRVTRWLTLCRILHVTYSFSGFYRYFLGCVVYFYIFLLVVFYVAGVAWVTYLLVLPLVSSSFVVRLFIRWSVCCSVIRFVVVSFWISGIRFTVLIRICRSYVLAFSFLSAYFGRRDQWQKKRPTQLRPPLLI